MPASADDPLGAARLTTWERALVVLAVTHHGPAAPAVLARLAPPAGPRCGAAAEALLALPAAERAPTLAREATRLFAPVPAGLGRVHPTWVAAALGAVPPAAQAVLRSLLPAAVGDAEPAAGRAPGAAAAAPRPEALAWLARVALGSLCPMPPAGGAGGDLVDLARGPADVLLATLQATGRERVALALRHAPRSARAAFCARLPAEEAAALVRAIDTIPDDPAAARRAQGDLAEVAAGAPAEVDGLGLIRRMGALAVGAAVAAEGDAPRELAQLLPLDLGLLLLGAAGAGGGAATAPSGSLPARGEQVH